MTKKSVAIFLLSCGISGLLGDYVYAQWGWNPFSSRSQLETQQTTRSSFFSSPFAFGSDKPNSAKVTQQKSARPISDQTRRQIVEMSRQYPLQQRQEFIKSFAGLTDDQAKLRLQKVAIAQQTPYRTPATATPSTYNQTRSTSSNYPTRTTTNPVRRQQSSSWDRAIAQAQTTSPTRQTSYSSYPSSNPIRQTSNSQVSENPFLRRQQGFAAPGTASTQTTPKPVVSNPGQSRTAPAYPTTQPTTPAMTLPPSAGTASMHPTIQPAPAERPQLPVIRPASSNVNDPHYQANYSPAKSEVAPSPQPVASNIAQRNSLGSPTQPTRSQVASREIGGPELSLLISRAEALAAASTPGTTEAELQQHITRHVDLRLLYLLAGERDLALNTIPGINPNEQTFWTRTIWALANYLDHPNYPNKSDRTTVALEQLRNAIQSLQGDAHLTVRNAAFCSDIESFGNYTRYPRNEFAPGQEVLIYSELDNFKSEQNSEGMYRTVLKAYATLSQAGPHGRVIDQEEYNETEDLCHSHRSDFMQGYRYQLPERLAPGAYVLQLTIEDKLSGKTANYSLSFLVR